MQYGSSNFTNANNWACKFQDGRTSMEIFEDMVTPRPRYYLGELVLWKIRQYQAWPDLLIRKLPFRQLVWEIIHKFKVSHFEFLHFLTGTNGFEFPAQCPLSKLGTAGLTRGFWGTLCWFVCDCYLCKTRDNPTKRYKASTVPLWRCLPTKVVLAQIITYLTSC